mmetsp:Transcript_32710/g.47858  ORF Transcript_32710/g.47858 Transcript_32710/m.47858 type:complete len:103 (-) Transcript_32710:212-520(-)
MSVWSFFCYVLLLLYLSSIQSNFLKLRKKNFQQAESIFQEQKMMMEDVGKIFLVVFPCAISTIAALSTFAFAYFSRSIFLCVPAALLLAFVMNIIVIAIIII